MCVQPAATGGFSSRLLLPLPLLFLLFFPYASPVGFSFTNFQSDNSNFTFQGDASSLSGAVHLTSGQPWSAGRAIFSRPLRLWDAATGNVASFSTSFWIGIKAGGDSWGDGVAFFFAPNGSSSMPCNSAGGYLGLFGNSTVTAAPAASGARLVAVELDTKVDDWDPPYLHVGVDVGSVRSRFQTRWAAEQITSGSSVVLFEVRVTFDGGSKSLAVIVKNANGTEAARLSNASVALDAALSSEWVILGFSATTSDAIESHEIYSWEFNFTALSSTEEEAIGPALALNTSGTNRPPVLCPNSREGSGGDRHPREEKKKKKHVLAQPLAVAVAAAAIMVAFTAWLVVTWYRKNRKEGRSLEMRTGGGGEGSTTLENMGPRRFSYEELGLATDNFNEERKLGKGAFGTVYRGDWNGSQVAIKRFIGEREAEVSFKAEAKAIGQLSHKNVVRLLGWCTAKKHRYFLIVYEYMPNRSLDLHLFGGHRSGQAVVHTPVLAWERRYAVALDLASALKYLHEDSRRCVVHRDIKPANVMLDADFNALLGDFGLARLGQHGHSMSSTGNAGTPGYMAPEDYCGRTHKPRKQSDVYSFGVVALEMATGRRASSKDPDVENLVSWVRRRLLQGGEDHLLGAADGRLGGDYDEGQLRCLMMVGLWCTLHDRAQRPTMSRVVQYLGFDAPVPELPPAVIMSERLPRSDDAIAAASKPPSMTSSVQHVGR